VGSWFDHPLVSVCEHLLPTQFQDKAGKIEITDPLMEQSRWNF